MGFSERNKSLTEEVASIKRLCEFKENCGLIKIIDDKWIHLAKNLDEKQLAIENEITRLKDSIMYARYIQLAALPPADVIGRIFPDNFIYYKPKDVVSGDFYWVAEKANIKVLAVGDCTGHGVPGAFLSILAISMLHEIVGYLFNHQHKISPGQILNKLRFKLNAVLHQNEDINEIDNGLDLGVVVYNTENLELSYAGARHPLLLIRNQEIQEYTPDRMSIGHSQKNKPFFTEHKIQLQEDDILYLFSDGYKDQFGGLDNRKLGSRRFKTMLHNVHKLELEKQREQIKEFFKQWKGPNAQVDDVLVMSIKIRKMHELYYDL